MSVRFLYIFKIHHVVLLDTILQAKYIMQIRKQTNHFDVSVLLLFTIVQIVYVRELKPAKKCKVLKNIKRNLRHEMSELPSINQNRKRFITNKCYSTY